MAVNYVMESTKPKFIKNCYSANTNNFRNSLAFKMWPYSMLLQVLVKLQCSHVHTIIYDSWCARLDYSEQ